MSLSNIGSAAINYPIVSLEGDSYVNVNTSGINNAYYWDYLSGFQGSNQEDLIANVTVSPLTPIGHIVEFTIHVNNLNGGLDISFPVSIAVGQIVEGFENDFSSSLNWGHLLEIKLGKLLIVNNMRDFFKQNQEISMIIKAHRFQLN